MAYVRLPLGVSTGMQLNCECPLHRQRVNESPSVLLRHATRGDGFDAAAVRDTELGPP
jgi:hypothetical protein